MACLCPLWTSEQDHRTIHMHTKTGEGSKDLTVSPQLGSKGVEGVGAKGVDQILVCLFQTPVDELKLRFFLFGSSSASGTQTPFTMDL